MLPYYLHSSKFQDVTFKGPTVAGIQVTIYDKTDQSRITFYIHPDDIDHWLKGINDGKTKFEMAISGDGGGRGLVDGTSELPVSVDPGQSGKDA